MNNPTLHENRRAREYALLFLYHLQFENALSKKEEVLGLIPSKKKEFSDLLPSDLNTHALQFAEQLVRGVIENYQELDQLITEYSSKKSQSKKSKVENTLLLVATYELKFVSETPNKVAIDEAIELAKRYGTHESGRYINAVLDKVAKNK